MFPGASGSSASSSTKPSGRSSANWPSNRAHPEWGQATIPFPIPDSEYDQTIGMLEGMGIGDAVRQDCRVDGLDSLYPILNRLTGQSVGVDELDFVGASSISLASAFGESSLISLPLLSKSKPLRWVSIWLPFKRLGSFFQGEDTQFEAMASKLQLSDIKDFINLTFCCQQATVITDFSNLEQLGKDHSLNINGGSMPTEEYDKLDGQAVALELIQSGAGAVTPYGVVYDNGMKLEQIYDGRHFPTYIYEPPQMVIEMKSGQDGAPAGGLCLPCPDRQLQRTLLRAGEGSQGFQMEATVDSLPPQVSALVSPTRDGLDDLNQLCRVIGRMDPAERKKLEAVVLMAQPTEAGEIRQLAENLDQFDFAPKPDSPEAGSALTELGYVAYHGSLTLEETDE